MDTQSGYDTTRDEKIHKRALNELKVLSILLFAMVLIVVLLYPWLTGSFGPLVDRLLILFPLSLVVLIPSFALYFMVKREITGGRFGVTLGQDSLFIGTGVVSRYFPLPELDYVLINQKVCSLLIKDHSTEGGPDITTYLNDPDKFWLHNIKKGGGGKYHFVVQYRNLVPEIEEFSQALRHQGITVYRILPNFPQIEKMEPGKN